MNITSFTLAEMPSNEAERQHATDLSGILQVVGDPVLMELAKNARLQSLAETALICAVTYHDVFVIAQDGVRPGVFSRTRSFVGHMIMNDYDKLVVPETRVDPRFAGSSLVENGDVHFYAAAGIRDEDGFLLGAVCVTSRKPRQVWSVSDDHNLQSIATKVTQFLSRRRIELMS
jgi:hypothetical protein